MGEADLSTWVMNRFLAASQKRDSHYHKCCNLVDGGSPTSGGRVVHPNEHGARFYVALTPLYKRYVRLNTYILPWHGTGKVMERAMDRVRVGQKYERSITS